MVKVTKQVVLKRMQKLDADIDHAKRMTAYFIPEENDPTHTAFGMWRDIHKQLVRDREKLAKRLPDDRKWIR